MTEKNPIVRSITGWLSHTFADPESISLFMTLVIGVLLLEFFGNILMPVLVSVILAYLLNSVVKLLKHWRCPHLLAVILVYLIFLGLFIYALVYLVPLLWRQLTNLIKELPSAFLNGQVWFENIIKTHHHFIHLFSSKQIESVGVLIQDQTPKLGQAALHFSLKAIPNVAEIILYFILVPLLVFFFLKDSEIITKWLTQFLPKKRTLMKKVWLEVHKKIGCYVRGRVIEILIVGIASVIVFACLNLEYAILLGALVGISVIVPYIGAIIVTIPVVIVALMEWGLSAPFWYLIIAYAIIIAIDGNILFPILFSETMDLHPIVIILSVLIFGGIWGFWGVFFAIPLATLVNAVLQAWPLKQ